MFISQNNQIDYTDGKNICGNDFITCKFFEKESTEDASKFFWLLNRCCPVSAGGDKTTFSEFIDKAVEQDRDIAIMMATYSKDLKYSCLEPLLIANNIKDMIA